jgi:glycosyltransferase involved in cell wall biosynthesis
MYATGSFVDEADQVLQPISIVVPAHNEGSYLKETLNALTSAVEELKELGVEAEIIVVNDSSTDQTAEIAREHGVRVTNVELRNIGAVRNAGAKLARHNWLFFVDADTVVPARTLREAMEHLAQGGIGGGANVDLDGQQPLPWIKQCMYLGLVTIWLKIGGWAAGCFMFCRKDAFDSFGGFDEQFFAAEEYFFSTQLKQRGRFRLMKTPVITSARKLYNYSTFQLFQAGIKPFLKFGSPFKSREGLDIFYQDQR